MDIDDSDLSRYHRGEGFEPLLLNTLFAFALGGGAIKLFFVFWKVGEVVYLVLSLVLLGFFVFAGSAVVWMLKNRLWRK